MTLQMGISTRGLKKSFIKKLFLVTSFDKASGLENEFLVCLQYNQTNFVES